MFVRLIVSSVCLFALFVCVFICSFGWLLVAVVVAAAVIVIVVAAVVVVVVVDVVVVMVAVPFCPVLSCPFLFGRIL